MQLFSFIRVTLSFWVGIISCLSLITGCADKSASKPWMSVVRNEMGNLGARNWIVISEAAFPIQSRRGLKVLKVDADIPEVLDGVETIIEETHHVKPRLFISAEFANVPYDYAPGIDAHKKELNKALHGRKMIRLDNEMLMRLLSDTSKIYRVLVLKTRTAIPYSSLFIELGSGYWDAESESVLRARMRQKR